jgi:hypothetical protein
MNLQSFGVFTDSESFAIELWRKNLQGKVVAIHDLVHCVSGE